MKNIFYILLLLPTFIFAQYPGNANQKITLGEQTTADGLVFRGVASIDTVTATSKITRANKQDTSAYLLLDTVTNLLWHYKTGSNAWTQAGGSTLTNAVTGTGTTTYIPKFTGTSTIGNSNLINNASGNLGLGVTPSAWLAGLSVIQGTSSLSVGNSGNGGMNILSNGYYGSNWTYVSSAQASWYQQIEGKHAWYSAPSGTANNPISFTQAMTLNASGNLSIGNTNDTYKLDVSGTGRFSGQLTASTTVGGTSAIFQNTGAQNSNGIELRGGTSGTAINWKIEKDNTVGNAFQLTPSTTNGGTTYTTPVLSIASTGAATFSSTIEAARYLANSSSASLVGFGVSAGNGMYNAGTDVVAFSTASTERMRITSGGNVGIGTVSPLAKLQVNGSSSVSEFALKINDVSNNNLLSVQNNGVATFSSSVNIGTSLASGNALTISNLTNLRQFQFGYSTGAGYNYFQVYDGTSFQPLNINNTIHILGNGNVGIGTTSPSTGYGGTISNVKLALRNGTVGSNNGTSVLLIGGDDNHYSSITAEHTSGGKTYLAFGTSSSATNPSERMRITDEGNVGIGTASPLSKLNVMGTVRINSASAPDANYYLQLENSSSQKAKAYAWDTYSDSRIKTEIQPIFNAIDKVNLLNPVYYQKHDSYVENDFLNIDFDSSVKSLGFIAQEVYNVIPEAVNKGTTNELWAMDYTKIIPILTKAIQEQQALIKALEQRILNLENK